MTSEKKTTLKAILQTGNNSNFRNFRKYKWRTGLVSNEHSARFPWQKRWEAIILQRHVQPDACMIRTYVQVCSLRTTLPTRLPQTQTVLWRFPENLENWRIFRHHQTKGIHEASMPFAPQVFQRLLFKLLIPIYVLFLMPWIRTVASVFPTVPLLQLHRWIPSCSLTSPLLLHRLFSTQQTRAEQEKQSHTVPALWQNPPVASDFSPDKICICKHCLINPTWSQSCPLPSRFQLSLSCSVPTTVSSHAHPAHSFRQKISSLRYWQSHYLLH